MITTALAAPVVAAPAATLLAHWGPMGWHPGGFGFLFLLIPLFWIGVIILIVSLVTRRRRRFWAANGGYPGWGGRPGWGGPGYPGAWAAQAQGSSDAEKTLAERFAQGDIDEVEYRARLEVLRANRSGPTPPAPPAA
ncbi:SHOCT domain-containing protein [Subtercola sp. YIM 133946]|uniref:SHOCT domain-containing protein n=1 Tax=Subtercola sp. YIM 133946 TaxID=3118909 RepID=UPI002F9316B4